MRQIAFAELKKLRFSKMWWLILIGAILPVIITCLSLLEQTNLTWQVFIHVAMLCFNVPSLLTFSTFAAFLWAREHEENTIEISMCYPYPKHHFLTIKLLLMLLTIGLTVVLFVLTTIVGGLVFLSDPLEADVLLRFLYIALSLIIMHFLIIPGAFLAAILIRRTFSGMILGILCMCLCMTLYSTRFIQFLPPCIPFVLSDHLLGMNVMQINPNYAIHWTILGGYFIGLLVVSYFLIRNRVLN